MKEAFSVIGPFIVIEAGLVVPEKEPVPLPAPAAEAVAVGWRCRDRDGRPLFFHPLAGTHRATGSVSHRQVILRLESRCVSLVGGRRNSVRDSSATSPLVQAY